MNHRIIDFDFEIRKKTEIEILDNLYEQGIDFENFKLSSKEYKRLFYNYYIKNIIELINNTEKKPFFIITKPIDSELLKYFDEERLEVSYRNCIDKLLKILPIKNHCDLSKTYDEILKKKESEFVEWIITQITNQNNKGSELSYKSIKKTVEYYDLTFINNRIFRDLQYRMVF